MPKLSTNTLLSMRARAPRKHVAIANFSAANYYATAAGGGEAGVSTGFIEAVLVRPDASTFSAVQMLAQRMNNANAGHELYISGSAVTAAAASSGGPFVFAPARTLAPSDAQRLHLFILQHDGAFMRLWTHRQQAGGNGAAISGYAPIANAHVLGYGFSLFASGVPILSTLTARGVPSPIQIAKLFDYVRVNGDLPFAMDGATVTHRWSLATTLGDSVTDGELAPPIIEDTITAAVGDRMTRTGSPIVRVIDSSGEGQETFGVFTESLASYLRSAVSSNWTAATGVWFSVWAIPWTIATGGITYRALIDCGLWRIFITNGAQIQCTLNGGATAPEGAVTSSMIGRPLLLTGHFNGTGIELFINGVATGAPTAATQAPAARDLRILADWQASNGAPATYGRDWSILRVAIGRFTITPAEAQAQYREAVRSGRITIPGKTEHDYNLTRDIIANGGPANGIPAQVLDRIGTDHLTRQGGQLAVIDGGIGGYGTSCFLRTTGPGLLGSVAGFWFEVLVTKRPYAVVDEVFIGTYVPGAEGWYLDLNIGRAILSLRISGGAIISTPAFALTDGVHHIAGVYDGTVARLYVDGVDRGASSTFTFAPAASASTTIGAQSTTGAISAINQVVHGASGGHFIPTPAEIATAAAAALSTGKVVGMPGKTDLRWSLTDDIIDAGGQVPGVYRERVAGVKHMIAVNGSLQVAQRKKRLWSYETKPILHSTADMDVSAKSISCAGGTAGEATDLWFALLIVVTSQTAPGTKTLGGKRDGSFTKGWDALISANNLQIVPRVRTTGGTISGPVASVNQADIGKLLFIGGVLDPISGVLRTYFNRAQASTGTSLGGTYIPDTTSPCTIGPPVTAVGGATGTTLIGARVFGMMCGRGLPTLAQWQAAADAAQVREDLVAIPGMTEHLWSVSRAVKNNGGTMPATIPDLIGTDHMTVAGGLSSEGHYARSWGW